MPYNRVLARVVQRERERGRGRERGREREREREMPRKGGFNQDNLLPWTEELSKDPFSSVLCCHFPLQ